MTRKRRVDTGGTAMVQRPESPDSSQRNLLQAVHNFKVDQNVGLLHKSIVPFIAGRKFLQTRLEKRERRLRLLLNMLTPQNFERCCGRLLSVRLDTETTLKELVNTVVGMAVSGPLYSEVYATCCKVLMQLPSVPKEQQHPPHPHTERIHFSKLLLLRLQDEFESDKRKQMMASFVRDPAWSPQENKVHLKAALAEAEVTTCRHVVAISRFVGELFKLHVLPCKPVVLDCIFKLEDRQDQAGVEGLCSLLTTVGHKLHLHRDTDVQDALQNTLGELVKMVSDGKYTKKVSCVISNLLQLRKNNWRPRYVQDKPTTLEQLHDQDQTHGEGHDVGGDGEDGGDGEGMQRHTPDSVSPTLARILRKEQMKGAVGVGEDVADGSTTMGRMSKEEEEEEEDKEEEKASCQCVTTATKVDFELDWSVQDILTYFLSQESSNEHIISALKTTANGGPARTVTCDDVAIAAYIIIDSAVNQLVQEGPEEPVVIRLDGALLEYRCQLLLHLLQSDVQCQVWVLYGAQVWAHNAEHPPGVLRQVFDILYWKNVVSEETFSRWIESPDPHGEPGKQLALMSTSQFFVWLQEAEPVAC